MTWWTDFVAQISDLFWGLVPAPYTTAQLQGVSSGIEMIASIINIFLGLVVSLYPYMGIILFLYVLDVLAVSLQTGSFQPIGNMTLRIFEILVNIGEAVAAAIPL